MSKQNYLLTLFDEGIEDYWRDIHKFLFETGKVKYLGSQLEKCPETQRFHWQAFVHLHKHSKQRGTFFKRTLHNKIHFEAVSTLTAEAINYGTKEDTRVDGPEESGTKPLPTQSARKAVDYEALKSAILLEQWDDIPFEYVLRFRLHLHKYQLQSFYWKDQRKKLGDYLDNPWGKVLPVYHGRKQCHYWIWSRKPGVGKTYMFSRPLEREYRVEVFMKDMAFQDHIKSTTEGIIIDDYNEPCLRYDMLNSLCDGYYPINHKGQPAFYLREVLIIVCSNKCISELYKSKPEGIPLLHSRFIEVQVDDIVDEPFMLIDYSKF